MTAAGRRRRAHAICLASVGLGLSLAAAVAGAPPPSPARSGQGFDVTAPQFDRDAGAAAWIRTVSPPPPSTMVRCPDAPRCPGDSDVGQLAWLLAGLATAGMLLATSWAALQHRRAQLIREELSRIRIQRTSQIRATRSLADRPLPPPGLGRPADPVPSGSPSSYPAPRVPLAGRAAASASLPPAAPTSVDPAVRDQAEARLAGAQAELAPLLAVTRSVEEWFRSREVESSLGPGGPARALFDKVRRGVVAVSATLQALREARLFPASAAGIEPELERYWEQVYESFDDVLRLAAVVASDEWRLAVAGLPGAEAMRLQIERLLEAARGYLASDGRRPMAIVPLRTDFDRHLHHSVEARRVPGLAPGKVVAVVRCGILREGQVVRTPHVVHSV